MSAQPGTTYGTRFRFEATGTWVYAGTGTPEGAQVGTVGDLYVRADASLANPPLYYKASGTATNTGWEALGLAPAYGEMFAYENVVASSILTNNVYHAIQGIFATGDAMSGVTFTAGSTGTIASVAEGTVGDGKVTVTDVAHGLVNGDYIRIVNSTDYDGKYAVTKLTDDTFEIAATWTQTRTGTWLQGDYLTIGAAGVYAVDWSLSADGVSATSENYHVEVVKNLTDLDNMASESLIAGGTDISVFGSGGLVTLAAGDRLWMQFKQTTAGTDGITIGHGNLRVRRVGS